MLIDARLHAGYVALVLGAAVFSLVFGNIAYLMSQFNRQDNW